MKTNTKKAVIGKDRISWVDKTKADYFCESLQQKLNTLKTQQEPIRFGPVNMKAEDVLESGLDNTFQNIKKQLKDNNLSVEEIWCAAYLDANGVEWVRIQAQGFKDD